MKNIKAQIFALFPKFFRELPYADKIAHALFGLAIYIMFSWGTPLPNVIGPKELSLLIVFFVGAGIEIYDDRQKGGMGDWADMLATWSLATLLYYLQAGFGVLIIY